MPTNKEAARIFTILGGDEPNPSNPQKYVDFATFNVDYDKQTADLVGDFKKDELLALSNS